MTDSTRTEALLEEIRDLLSELAAENRAQSERGVALAEESVERQRRFAILYRRVLVVGGLLIVGVVIVLVWLISSGLA
jgi:CHASE3 domain sensor protein